MADEIQNLILKVEGEEKVAALNVELKKETLFLKELLEIQRQGVVGVNPTDIQNAAARMIGLNTQIAELNKGSKLLASPAGLLQLQYVMDDLINTSGDWTLHLASISNNIPGLISSLGLGAGVAGAVGIVTTGLIALAPVAREAWAAIAGHAPEIAKEKLKEIAQEIEKIKKEFDKLAQHPTTAQEVAAAGAKAYLEEPGATNAAQRLAADALSRKDIEGAMNDEDKSKILKSGAAATYSDAEIARMARQQYWRFRHRLRPDEIAREEERLRGEREKSKNQRETVYNDVRQRTASGLVVDAAKAGNAGESARGRLRQLAPSMAGDLRSESQTQADMDESDAWQEQTDKWSEEGKARRAKAAEAKRDKAEEKRMAHQIAQATAQNRGVVDRIDAEAARAREREGQAADRSVQNRLRRGPVDDYAAEMSRFNDSNRTGLNDEQIQSAAAEAVNMVRKGADVNDALMSAFQGQIQQMQQLQQRLQMQAARANQLMMGADNSGQFSQLSPMPGY